MATSRTRHLEETLSILKFDNALRAFDLVLKEMCAEKGFKRHNGTHYYFHLVDVAQKLINFGIRDEDIITAALLHDIVEDVPDFTIELIQKLFNPRVAHIVNLVTKKPGLNYKIPEILIDYLEKISEDYGAALVKTADRMHNFGTLKDASPEKKLRQALETEQYFIPFFKKCRKQYPRYAAFFFEAKTQIEPHLWAIKEHDVEVKRLETEHNEKIVELMSEIERLKKE